MQRPWGLPAHPAALGGRRRPSGTAGVTPDSPSGSADLQPQPPLTLRPRPGERQPLTNQSVSNVRLPATRPGRRAGGRSGVSGRHPRPTSSERARRLRAVCRKLTRVPLPPPHRTRRVRRRLNRLPAPLALLAAMSLVAACQIGADNPDAHASFVSGHPAGSRGRIGASPTTGSSTGPSAPTATDITLEFAGDVHFVAAHREAPEAIRPRRSDRRSRRCCRRPT